MHVSRTYELAYGATEAQCHRGALKDNPEIQVTGVDIRMGQEVMPGRAKRQRQVKLSCGIMLGWVTRA
jgi:hypothetical protein